MAPSDNNSIGEKLSLLFECQVVSKRRKRFFVQRLERLENLARPGRPSDFSLNVVIQVKAVACELPCERGILLSRFSMREIATEFIRRGIVSEISGSTINNENLDRSGKCTSCTIFPPHYKELPGQRSCCSYHHAEIQSNR